MISGMRIIMRRRSVRMNIKYGSTVKRAQFPSITGNVDLNLWFQED